MMLRRITEHVKAQNWFAVGLDFVIVVDVFGKAAEGSQASHLIERLVA
jgi:hypothetical protein